MEYMIALSGAFVLGVGWYGVCIERTYRQRCRIIDAMITRDDRDAYLRVSYSDHLWALFFFRDPRKLYGHIFAEATVAR